MADMGQFKWWPDVCPTCGKGVFVAHRRHDWACVDRDCEHGHGHEATPPAASPESAWRWYQQGLNDGRVAGPDAQPAVDERVGATTDRDAYLRGFREGQIHV